MTRKTNVSLLFGAALGCLLLVVLYGALTSQSQEIFDPSGNTTSPTFSGQVKGADGSGTIPSYTFTNDTDLGWYRIGSDNLGFAAGGGLRWDFNTARLNLSSSYRLTWTGMGGLGASADGVHVLQNNAGTDYTRLQFGGTTSSFPGLERSGTTLKARLADGSGEGAFQADRFLAGRQQVTVADNTVGASAAAFTLTPTADFIEITCNDPDGCTATVSESGASMGDVVRIVNITANVVNFADSGGVTELAGALAMGQWDSLSMLYLADRYVELARANN